MCPQHTSCGTSFWHCHHVMRCFAVFKPFCSFVSIFSPQQPRTLAREHGAIGLTSKAPLGRESSLLKVVQLRSVKSRIGCEVLYPPWASSEAPGCLSLSSCLPVNATQAFPLTASKGDSSDSVSTTLHGIHSAHINGPLFCASQPEQKI